MSAWTSRLLIGAFSLFGCGFATAQEIGDPTSGRILSRQLCTDCHAVEPGDDQSPRSKAWPFQKIARTPGMTGIALAAWLHSSHRTMPLIKLDARTRRDVTAYIISLRTNQKQGQ